MKASKRLTAAATVCAIVCTAAVLRAPITSMGTLSMTVQGDLGLSATTMGLLTTLPLLAFAASALFMGAIANRFGKELVMAVVLFGFASSDALAVFAVAFLGLALGAPFSLCMFYFSERAACAEDSARLSSISQTFGYLLAAAGPICMGAIFDATGTWSAPLGLMVVLGAAVTVCSWKAGKGSLPAA